MRHGIAHVLKRLAPCGALIAVVSAGNLHAQQVTDFSGQRTVSRSRQFIIYSTEREWRVGVAVVAEDTKAWLLGKWRLRDNWETPLVISITRASTAMPDRKPAQLRVFQTEIGPKIQLDLVAGPQENPISLRREILRALLTELSLREQPVALANPRLPSDWLVNGLAALQEYEDEGSNKAGFYAALLESRTLPALRDFIHKTPLGMDSMSARMYEGYAAALIYTLLDLRDGRAGLVAFLKKRVASEAGEFEDLQASIPSVGEALSSFDKWWSLGLARLSVGDRHEPQGVEETGAQLSSALGIRLKGKENKEEIYTFNDFQKIRKHPGLKRGMSAFATQISLFATTANPLYFPLIDGYARVAAEIAAGKTRGIEKQVAELNALRKEIETLGGEMIDYINWFEATQIGVSDGEFDAYLRAARQGPTPPPRRNDMITRYLDSIEMEME